jgi:hypothetical protein
MEGSVLGSKILPAILIVVPVTVLLTAQACLSEPAAEECISRPTAVTPRGAHWYYRINRAKQHCWYLGKADGRANASAVTSATPTSASAPQHGNAAEAPAADAPEATSPPVAPAATAFAPAAPAQAAPTQAVSEPALSEQGPRIGFATRWPENLPNAEDLDQQEPAAISDSYAERHEATNPAAQMPSKWPGVEADRARAASAGEMALRYFTVAGTLAIPLLLAAGWGAKFARRPRRSPIRDWWRTMAERLRPRRHVDFAEMSGIKPAAETRRDDLDRRMPMPTDPAYDLKTSLAELMRDLRRAGAFEPVQPAARPAYQTNAEEYCSALEAAE